MFLAFINTLWIFAVIVFKISWSSYYGPAAFFESEGPFPSGGFFLMLFIFLFNIFIFYYGKLSISLLKKILLFVLCTLPVVGVISSGSRTAVLGLAVSLGTTLLVYLTHRKISFGRIFKIIIVTIIIAVLFLVLINILGLSGRLLLHTNFGWEYGSSNPESRISILRGHLSDVLHGSLFNFFVGNGVVGEAHSQYIRVLVERGILGLLLFIWLMASIIKVSYTNIKDKSDLLKNSLAIGLFVATISMLVMAISNDVFMVVKPDEVYWVFAAMTLAFIVKSQHVNSYK
jgi:O-antigen ligase